MLPRECGITRPEQFGESRGQPQKQCVEGALPASSQRVPRRRQLGSPVVSVNPSGAYLRHRAAAQSAYRARQRTRWWQRGAACALLVVLYFAIGRDLIAMGRATKDTALMEVRYEVHTVAKDVERMTQCAQATSASEYTSPIAFTAAAALAQRGDPADVDAWLSEEPLETLSRASPQ